MLTLAGLRIWKRNAVKALPNSFASRPDAQEKPIILAKKWKPGDDLNLSGDLRSSRSQSSDDSSRMFNEICLVNHLIWFRKEFFEGIGAFFMRTTEERIRRTNRSVRTFRICGGFLRGWMSRVESFVWISKRFHWKSPPKDFLEE